MWQKRFLAFVIMVPSEQMTRTMVAESLSKVLEPMGFAPGKPGALQLPKWMLLWMRGLCVGCW